MLTPPKRPSTPPKPLPTPSVWLWGVGSVAIILVPLFWVVLAN